MDDNAPLLTKVKEAFRKPLVVRLAWLVCVIFCLAVVVLAVLFSSSKGEDATATPPPRVVSTVGEREVYLLASDKIDVYRVYDHKTHMVCYVVTDQDGGLSAPLKQQCLQGVEMTTSTNASLTLLQHQKVRTYFVTFYILEDRGAGVTCSIVVDARGNAVDCSKNLAP